jgi:hypothetical protein
VDEHFVGEKAEYIKCIANDMAQVTQKKIRHSSWHDFRT